MAGVAGGRCREDAEGDRPQSWCRTCAPWPARTRRPRDPGGARFRPWRSRCPAAEAARPADAAASATNVRSSRNRLEALPLRNDLASWWWTSQTRPLLSPAIRRARSSTTASRGSLEFRPQTRVGETSPPLDRSTSRWVRSDPSSVASCWPRLAGCAAGSTVGDAGHLPRRVPRPRPRAGERRARGGRVVLPRPPRRRAEPRWRTEL